MRRFALLLFASAPAVVGAQGFGVYEHSACAMGRAGVTAASTCPDGSAIFFNPAGLAGLSGTRASAGVTLIAASGSFTDDFLVQRTDLDDPVIPVPAGYVTRQLSPKATIGFGVYAPYGLQTRWPVAGFPGRFMGYDTKLKAIYFQPTVGYQLLDRLKVGIGVAYIHSTVELHQRVDLSGQVAPLPGLPLGTTFSALGIAPGTDFADAALKANGKGFAVNFGGILQVTDRLSIGGHWLTKRTITYDGTTIFRQVPTNIVLPPGTVGPAPVPLDGLLTALAFGTGAPLDSSGIAASTKLTLPPQGSIGFAYKLTGAWTVMADYQYVVWGWFNELTIDFKPATTPDITLRPHNDDSHGFRLGAEYRRNDKLTVRGGYLYHTASSPDDFVTPFLPEAPRNEFTIGFGVKLSAHAHGDLAYQHIIQNDRRGRVIPTGGNTGLFEFSGNLFGVGVAFTF
jgi:long-chain fatty acid transport protein